MTESAFMNIDAEDENFHKGYFGECGIVLIAYMINKTQ